MGVIAVQFVESRARREQAEVRRIIRKIRRVMLTKSERDILMAVVNLWFHHANGPLGYIHPGCETLANRANVSVITVKRALSRLRDYGVISAINHAKGGRNHATDYTVNLIKLREVFDPSGVVTIPGVLVEFVPVRSTQSVTNDTVCTTRNDTVYGYQNDTPSIEASDPSQEGGE